FETKWDGFRALVFARPSGARFQSRTGNHLSRLVPELAGPSPLRAPAAVLDGEFVALGRDGRPDFGAMSSRLRGGAPTPPRGASAPRAPVVFVAFDLLWIDGETLC